VVNGKIYVIGGIAVAGTGNRQNLQTVEVYDPETDTWTQGVDMPTQRVGLSTSVVDGKLYAIGGGLTPPPMELATVEEFVALSPE
jgi:N-acetylneuraminic acid mutarotase